MAPFDAFEQKILDAYGPLALSTDDVTAFRGRIRSGTLGALQWSDIRIANNLVVRRTPRLIRDTPRDYLKVCLPMDGQCFVAQDGREASLAPGDFVLYDTTRPYSAVFSDVRQILTVMIPRDLIRLSPRHLAHLTGQRIGGRHGVGALASVFIRELGKHVAEKHRAGDIYLADAILDILAASFAERLSDETAVEMTSDRRELVLRIRRFIEIRLSEPHLDVTSVAAAHHISVRQLQKLFEDEGHTVTRWIRDRRIEHCRRDLADVQYADTPVGSIAARWGLVNAAYFSRRFRAAHGMTPTGYRAHALSRPASDAGSGSVCRPGGR